MSVGAKRHSGTRTHGLTKHRRYPIWLAMVQRCHSPRHPAFPRYGGRGIAVWEPWRHSPTPFIAWLEAELGDPPPGHSLDRIDNDGDYEPGNLRWASDAVQARNRRDNKLTLDGAREIRRLYALGGVTKTALGERFGVTRRAVGMIIAGERWRDPTQGGMTMQYTNDEVAHHGDFQVQDLTGFSPEVEDKIDGLLLEVAAETKPAKVKGGQASSTNRAWSYGGRVD